MAGDTCPLSFITFSHALSDAIRIPKSPDSQLVKNAQLGEDVEFRKFIGVIIGAVWIAVGGFGDKLTPSILIEYVKTETWLVENGARGKARRTSGRGGMRPI